MILPQCLILGLFWMIHICWINPFTFFISNFSFFSPLVPTCSSFNSLSFFPCTKSLIMHRVLLSTHILPSFLSHPFFPLLSNQPGWSPGEYAHSVLDFLFSALPASLTRQWEGSAMELCCSLHENQQRPLNQQLQHMSNKLPWFSYTSLNISLE